MTTLFIWLTFGLVAYFIYKAFAAPKPAPRARLESSRDEPLDAAGWNTDIEFSPSNPRPVTARLKLNYRDAQGAVTERIVQAKECDTANAQGYLIGFCEMRDDIRTFRLDRIVRATDMDTGEIIGDMLAWADANYRSSPAASAAALLDDAADALRGLFYIGKADGRFTKKEKELFLAFCHRVSGDARITFKQIEEICATLPMPSMQAYKLICGRLAKDGSAELKAAVLETAEAMIATEKTVAAEEAEALAYMKKRFEKA